MPEERITANGQTYSPLDFLLGDADLYALEAKALPAKTSITVKRATQIQTVQTSSSTRTHLSTSATSRVASRSKRKIMYTLSGPVIAVAAGALAITILGGPVTWAIVGGLAMTAALGAAASYLLKKSWRALRTRWYQSEYITMKEQGGKPGFHLPLDALNGVRYVLKKRDVSAISDDVKDLWKAIAEYNKRKNTSITTCRGALELVYWYNRVWYIHVRLVDEMDVFIKFYNYLHGELNKAFVTDESALNKWNALFAIKRILTWVNSDYEYYHKNVCGKNTFHDTCYAHVGGKSKKPKISTSWTLTTEQRKANNRLWMDAIHICNNGESSIASYDAAKLLEEKKRIFKEIADNPSESIVDPSRLSASALASHLSAFDGNTAFTGDHRGFSSVNRTATEDTITESGRRPVPAIARGVVTTGVSTGLSVASTATRQALDILPSAIPQTLGQVAATSATSGGLSAAVTLPMQVFGEIKNIQIELQSLESELKKPVAMMDIEKMMTALRTLLKDGNVFEKSVDEITKILRYHEEFKAANEASETTCNTAFELAYRIVKTVKHFKVLQQYMPLYELFARIALNLNSQVDAIQTDKPYDRLAGEVATWYNSSDHTACKTSGLCYHGVEEEGD